MKGKGGSAYMAFEVQNFEKQKKGCSIKISFDDLINFSAIAIQNKMKLVSSEKRYPLLESCKFSGLSQLSFLGPPPPPPRPRCVKTRPIPVKSCEARVRNCHIKEPDIFGPLIIILSYLILSNFILFYYILFDLILFHFISLFFYGHC